jgi:GNAT superfamily N-acetyltransferase
MQEATTIVIRVLEPRDSLAELTHLLHAAYAPWGARGFAFNGVDQAEAVTAARVRLGVCLVACVGERLVGTALVHGPFRTAPSAYLQRPDIACVQQFAVHPEWQRLGIGSTLLAQCELCAGAAGYRQLALDTAAALPELVGYYCRRGYVAVDTMQWPGKRHASLVLAKPLVPRLHGPADPSHPDLRSHHVIPEASHVFPSAFDA